ncbi:MAG TPA: tyrosine-type recombinase/integrase, partial [Bacteroidales bacterium]|nr:tyrosine-type recombinase/integrase [Bacteroidales bacterium]
EEHNSAKSINRKISSLKAFYKFYKKRGIISEDPLQSISSQKVSKRVPQFVELEDMNKLFSSDLFEDHFEGWRDKAIIELFYATGMRLSELINLTKEDVDLYSQTVKVLGKRDKERVIPFGNQAKATLEKYFSLFEQKYGEMSQKSCIFVTLKNNKLNPKSVYRIVRRYLDMITTIDKRSPHIIRHTFATHLLNKGADINAIKEILGHSSLAATQIYTHNTIEKLKSIYQQAHPRA